MNLLLVDTGPLVALASKRDHAHERCTDFLKAYRGRLLTTWAVLTEFSHLAPNVAATLPLYQWIERGGLEFCRSAATNWSAPSTGSPATPTARWTWPMRRWSSPR
jgi:predicted nucleic acid-binding protein